MPAACDTRLVKQRTRGGYPTAKIIDCGKVSPASGCGHIIQAESEEEALRLAAEHAQEHGLQPSPELLAKVKEHMRDA